MTSSVDANWDPLILHGVNPTGKEIGHGVYGKVFEVEYEGTLCAAKEVLHTLVQPDDLQMIKDDFLSECQIWSTLRHPCVVQFLGSVIMIPYTGKFWYGKRLTNRDLFAKFFLANSFYLYYSPKFPSPKFSCEP